jgi:hypothetical protein
MKLFQAFENELKTKQRSPLISLTAWLIDTGHARGSIDSQPQDTDILFRKPLSARCSDEKTPCAVFSA